MITFKDWDERHADWMNRPAGLEPTAHPDPGTVALRTPEYGDKHSSSPISGTDAGSFGIGGSYSGITLVGSTLTAGAVPATGGNTANSIWRCYFVFDTAESGADSSNYTQIEFKVGTSFASADTICTGTTENNPGAGATTFVNVSFEGQGLYRPTHNKTLFVSITKTGGASVNFDTKTVSFGFEFLQERIA